MRFLPFGWSLEMLLGGIWNHFWLSLVAFLGLYKRTIVVVAFCTVHMHSRHLASQLYISTIRLAIARHVFRSEALPCAHRRRRAFAGYAIRSQVSAKFIFFLLRCLFERSLWVSVSFRERFWEGFFIILTAVRLSEIYIFSEWCILRNSGLCCHGPG